MEADLRINSSAIWCKIYIQWQYYDILKTSVTDIHHKFPLNLIISKFSYNIRGVTLPSPCGPGYLDTLLVTAVQKALLGASPASSTRLRGLGGTLIQHPALGVRGGPVQSLPSSSLSVIWNISYRVWMQTKPLHTMNDNRICCCCSYN